MSEIRGGDIEAIKNRQRDEGRPVKSDIFIHKGEKHFTRTDPKTGRVTIIEKI